MKINLSTYLNRAVVVLNIVAGLAAAIAVPLADLDITSTAGVIGGLFAIVTATVTWLKGWQAHEANVALAAYPAPVASVSPPA